MQIRTHGREPGKEPSGESIGEPTEEELSTIIGRIEGSYISGPPKTVRPNIGRRLEGLASKFSSWRDFIKALRPGSQLLEDVANTLLNGKTYFFREPEQFRYLEGLLPTISGTSVILDLCCSDGREAYSIAMVAAKVGKPVKILATDIRKEALAQARKGEYLLSSFISEDCGLGYIKLLECYTRVENRDGKWYRVVHPSIKDGVTFEKLNLRHVANKHVKFPNEFENPDIVFLRNVLIYMSNDDRRTVLTALTENCMHVGSYLFLGATEGISLMGLSTLEHVGHSVYRKNK